MKAVIMAGGKGTRLGTIAPDIPKPMIQVGGKPILLHQIENLKRYGITDIFLVVGHLRHVIIDYFGNGEAFGVNIEYIEEQVPLGTAGALYYLRNRIEDDFLLIYGDLFIDIDICRFIRFHKDNHACATMYVHPNSHPYDSDLVICDTDNMVIGCDSKHNKRNYDYNNCVNAGLYVFSISVLDSFKEPVKTDLEKDIIIPIIHLGGRVFAYKSTEYVKDMGTIDRLSSVNIDYVNGVCKARNLANPQRAIFLDRDGTINRYIGFLTKPQQMELLDGVAEAIKAINGSSYLSIVVTNQPVIARGDCTVQELNAIHQRLETLLGEQGAYIDDLYYCPHHPHSGYEGEISELKIECNCRKPKIGMIEAAATKYNINLYDSFMVGDTLRDIQAGRNAGLKSILLNKHDSDRDYKYSCMPDAECDNLLDAVSMILNGRVGEEKI